MGIHGDGICADFCGSKFLFPAFPAILANREAFELFRFAVHIGIAALLLVLDWRASGRVHPASLLILAGVAVIYAIAIGPG